MSRGNPTGNISPVAGGVPRNPSRIIPTRGEGFRAIARKSGRRRSTSSAQFPMARMHSCNRGGTFRRGRTGPPLPPDTGRSMKRLTSATSPTPIKIPLLAINRDELEERTKARKQTEDDRKKFRRRRNSDSRSVARTPSAHRRENRNDGRANESRRTRYTSGNHTVMGRAKSKKWADFRKNQASNHERTKQEAIRMWGGPPHRLIALDIRKPDSWQK